MSRGKALTREDFELLGTIGSGNSGVVYKCKVKRSFGTLVENQVVAIKEYKSWVVEEPGQYERITRELDVSREINHPNLIKSHLLIAGKGNVPSIVSSYYDGETLESKLKNLRARNEPINPYEGLEIVSGIGSAILELHKRGIIHRDIKPANIVVSNGQGILMDLGVAWEKQLELTTTNTFLGTLRYSSANYIFGHPYDNKIDLYSLGAVAYEIFLGEMFYGDFENWAYVIAAKHRELNYIGQNQLFSNQHFDRLVSIYRNPHVSFLIYTIIQRLFEFRKKSNILTDLTKWKLNQLWKRFFYFKDGKVKKGHPDFVLPFSNRKIRSYETFVSLMKANLTQKEMRYLKQINFGRMLYTNEFWIYSSRSLINETENGVITSLVAKGFLTADAKEAFTDSIDVPQRSLLVYRLHPSLLFLAFNNDL